MTRLRISPALARKAREIRLVVMDVDGVLTEGEIVVLASGEEIKFWNAKDRLLMALIRDLRMPLTFAWITGRRSGTVRRAAKDLGVRFLIQKCDDKRAALLQILKTMRLSPRQAAFVGDDLIDIAAMRVCGFSACPADAARDVRDLADYVSPFAGGRGAVRDVLELLLRSQNRWDAVLKPFL